VTTPEMRLWAPGDEVAVNNAFNRVFGKDRSLEEWAWKYGADSPPLPIVAAWDGRALVAHIGGIPVRVEVDGQRIKALQGADTMSLAAAERRPEWRDAWRDVMDRFAQIATADFGVALIYGFTGGHAVSHMVRRARYNSVAPRRIPLYVRRRRPSGRSLASRFFSARLIGDDEPALDRLWDRASRRYPVAVVRDSEHARRRLSFHPSVHYHRWLITPRLSSTPAAFVAFRTDGGVIRWVDLVWDGRPGALELVDHLSRELARRHGCAREELWLDGDSEAARWLQVFGFEGGPDPSGVTRVIRFLDESLDPESFAPERYYTTMADADLV